MEKKKRTFNVIGGCRGVNNAGFTVGFIDPPYIFDDGKAIDEIRLFIKPHNSKKTFSLDFTRKEANQIGDLLKQASVSKDEAKERFF